MSRNILLRHGESLANVAGLIASSPANAGAAYGLTPRGRDQVRRSVEIGRDSGALAGVCEIISSPLLRTLESARIAAEALGVRVRIDERLIERGFGSLELTSDHGYDQVWAADRLDPSHRGWGVESVASVLDRVRALLAEVGAGSAQGAPRILCTHGDVASVAICASLGRSLGEHRDVGALGNGELRWLDPERP